MDVFISWSGKRSKEIAEVIREWIPCVIQAVKPYFTPEDINKGQRWGSEISSKLESSKIGIIILTPSNLAAPWLMFEAGAISKSVDASRVCPLLFGVTPTEVKGPLVQFQCSVFGKSEIFKLLRSINNELEDTKLEEKTLTSVFEVFWPKLNQQIEAILNLPESPEEPETKRTDRDILEEVLRLSRKFAFDHVRTPSRSSIFEKFDGKKPVTFDPESESISFWSNNSKVYDFRIDRLTSGSEVLDWFFQIANKGWCTGEHLTAFLKCLEQISQLYFDNNAQGVFCPGGMNLEIEWPKTLPPKTDDL
ncbi:TIR domain-containing protein [Zhongshania sp. BJYM1]|uniref:TIR domain-containing protein n=1 Tax=Zhongshania aquatica TaxID=2965069 RepID=UPI0022B52533|nr:TIR domain-containing protein [Marortus sp. BJYM1]